MNDNHCFEDELRRLKPASPSEDFQKRLLGVAAHPSGRAKPAVSRFSPQSAWLASYPHLRSGAWLAVPAAALLLVAAFVWRRPPLVPPPARHVADFVPDSITLSQEVLARYDGGIVQRPDGEVVRLTCYDRVNRVILKDSRQGSVVEHREPQREIVPVHLDVY